MIVRASLFIKNGERQLSFLHRRRIFSTAHLYALTKTDEKTDEGKVAPCLVLILHRLFYSCLFYYGYFNRKNTEGFAGSMVKAIWLVALDPGTSNQVLVRPVASELV